MLEQLLGTYVFHLIFRRAAFSVLSSAFRFARNGSSPTQVQRLPADVRSEIASLALLGPLLDTDLRAQVAPRIWCTDASPTAAAVVHADLPASAAREMWRHRDSRGAYVRLSPKEESADGLHVVESPEAEALLQSALQAIIDKDGSAQARAEQYLQYEASGSSTRIFTEPFAPPSRDAWVSELVDSLPFDIDLRYAYKRPDHINILEAQSRLSLYKLVAREPAFHSMRHVVGQDSRVNIGSYAKGRSPAIRLNHVVCKAGAYELAIDCQFGSFWVDSFRMPADAPTRDGGIRCPSPARQWVSDFLGGDLAALDARLGA